METCADTAEGPELEVWQQVDRAIDLLAATVQAGHVEDVHSLSVDLHAHFMSLQRDDRARCQQLARLEFEIEGSNEELGTAEHHLEEINQDILQVTSETAEITQQVELICSELERIEAERATLQGELNALNLAAAEREAAERAAAAAAAAAVFGLPLESAGISAPHACFDQNEWPSEGPQTPPRAKKEGAVLSLASALDDQQQTPPPPFPCPGPPSRLNIAACLDAEVSCKAAVPQLQLRAEAPAFVPGSA
eukprot:TRINITY_DN1772_c0_g1_i2.p1 TRINITY_DN1772_c0_g1~~TRINITY_DN1772_c0_g1_i2.p1  ORF type:complete len:251 (-),score=77.97 TRINITY_DN1772_c0_g1_i2:353-1105(-)